MPWRGGQCHPPHGQPKFSTAKERQDHPLADHAPLFVLGLPPSNGLLPDVHEVTVHAGAAGKGGHDAVGFPAGLPAPLLQKLFALEGLLLQKFTVLDGDFAVEIRAHLAGQLGHGEEGLKHLVQAAVLFSRDLKVGALLGVGAHQLLDLPGVDLPVEVPVALVPADDQGDVHVLLGLVLQARFGLHDLLLQALDLFEGVAVVQAEDQDEDVSWKREGKEMETGRVRPWPAGEPLACKKTFLEKPLMKSAC